jgi:hypothetical protein
VEQREGKALFSGLRSEADVVIESFEPGHLDRLGLGYERCGPRIRSDPALHLVFRPGRPYASYRETI